MRLTPSSLGQRVVEKHYSAKELSWLIGFDARFWRDKMKSGELTLYAGHEPDAAVLARPVEISGEFFCPASCVNAFLLRHPVHYDLGVKARNTGELRRKLADGALADAA